MLYELKNLQSRAASAENPQALPGAGGTARNGRKGAPCIEGFKASTTVTLLDTEGPGILRHIWCTVPPGNPLHLRNLIFRIYWDGQETPSVEAPLGDFFGLPHGAQPPLHSELLAAQAGKGFNCWIPMPFRQRARVTVENDADSDVSLFFYQIDFTRGDVLDENTAYLHAQFRRMNPCPIHEDFELLHTAGRGVYLGTVLGVRSLHKDSWWGEGEVKFFFDGEAQPTICGTGAEDYIGCAWGLSDVSTPLQGCHYINNEQGFYSIYRFHTRDPIYFNAELRVTIQQIGYGSGRLAAAHFGQDYTPYRAAGAAPEDDFCFFDRQDDYCCVAYWYQTLPTAPFPALPGRQARSADLPTDKAAARTDV